MVVSGAEIKVPRGVREFMPSWVEPTLLGDPCNATNQYRYGNLHIREYADHYTVHVDKADPRRDPIGHLVHDAPEMLAGLAAGAVASALVYVKLRRAGKGHGVSMTIAADAAVGAGLLAYEGLKLLKERTRTESGNGGGNVVGP